MVTVKQKQYLENDSRVLGFKNQQSFHIMVLETIKFQQSMSKILYRWLKSFMKLNLNSNMFLQLITVRIDHRKVLLKPSQKESVQVLSEVMNLNLIEFLKPTTL